MRFNLQFLSSDKSIEDRDSSPVTSTGIYTPLFHHTHLSNSNNVTIEVLNGHTKQSVCLVPCSSINVMVKPIILQRNDTTKISTRYP